MNILDKMTETLMAFAMLVFMGAAFTVITMVTLLLMFINGIIVYTNEIRKELKWLAKKD